MGQARGLTAGIALAQSLTAGLGSHQSTHGLAQREPIIPIYLIRSVFWEPLNNIIEPPADQRIEPPSPCGGLHESAGFGGDGNRKLGREE